MTVAFRYLLKSVTSLSIAALLLGSLGAAPAAADPEDPLFRMPAIELPPSTVTDRPDRFIVKFTDRAQTSAAAREMAYDSTEVLGSAVEELRTTGDGAVVLEADKDLTEKQVEDVLATLEARPDVEYAEVDQFATPAAVPNDQMYPLQWNLHEAKGGMRVQDAWNSSTGAGVTVAVIDTGSTLHTDLAANTVPGWDFIADPAVSGDGGGRDSDPSDTGDACGSNTSSWHGTHVAGTVAAAGNNTTGIAGVAYKAKVQHIRVMGICGGWTSDIAPGIVWAAGGTIAGIPNNATPAKVINLSLGTDASCGRTYQDAINFAVSRGAVVIAAAGNSARPVANTSPADCQNVVTVGATNRNGDQAPYSSYGPEVDVSAPGGDMSRGIEGGILATFNQGYYRPGTQGYSYLQGTSMATPHVAGAAALMLSANKALTPAQIEENLKKTVRPLPGNCFGGCGTGLVDATAAVKSVATPFSPGTFKDVPSGTQFHKEMSWMATERISTGWTEKDGSKTYRPLTSVNRDAMAAFMYRMANSPAYTPPAKSPFADFSTNQQFYTEMSWLASTGISSGWTENNGTKTYRALTPVNRDAMAAFMYRMAGSPAFAPPAQSPFADVSATQQFYKEMAWLASTGISTGWTENNGTKTYRALTPVNRDAMAAFMFRYSKKF
ncbi:serine protease [Arthrobacter sp. CAN_A212]|uniref:S8 family peptidase n=1 Tax=unclassified Arthrobacter TaxID=235627 RepID=UPI001A31924E|nr:S8 family peptidase [Arthrobacter sp. CAN_C5]MBP2217277.1 serine protease [Arthrobacter sp. CAN_C5]